MTAYYNEIDKKCCEVLRRQIANGNLEDGLVDQRSIKDVQPEELKNYNECHFFAGIGGFSLGFFRANIPADVSIWTGGFPCQDLSVAGNRAGLAGERSGLYFEFHRLIAVCRPNVVILENVPGLLSSNRGKDFAVVLGGLTGIVPEVPEGGWGNAGIARGPVYKVAYRVLDAQYFGVPQRRRRVFIVGCLGDISPSKILFERESGTGYPESGRKAGKETPKTIIVNTANGSANQNNAKVTDTMDTLDTLNSIAVISNTITTEEGIRGPRGDGKDNLIVMAHGQANAEILEGMVPTMNSNHEQPIIFQQNTRDEVRLMGGEGQYAGALAAEPGMKQQNYVFEMSHPDDVLRESGEIVPTLQSRMGTGGNQVPMVASMYETGQGFWQSGNISGTLRAEGENRPSRPSNVMATNNGIRRLTPTEAERLQGFPDGWTGEQKDAPRYKQLGNAVAVPVIRWIRSRVEQELNHG